MKIIIMVLLTAGLCTSVAAQQLKTKNVIIITLDGLRWQELFHGADSALINSKYTDDKPAGQLLHTRGNCMATGTQEVVMK
jgi:hypothetical protein